MKLNDKHKKIFELQKGYWTLTSIAEDCSISTNEAKELLIEVDNYLNQTDFEKEIPVLVKKQMVYYTNDFDFFKKPEAIAKMKPKDIKKVKYIGQKSLEKIAIALEKYGYISTSHDWLKKK